MALGLDEMFLCHKYVFMRTTLDLPDDLLRRAKATAALRGISLKQYFTSALSAYEDVPVSRCGNSQAEPVALPLIVSERKAVYQIDPDDIEKALGESEARDFSK
jgi:hypothetical protein